MYGEIYSDLEFSTIIKYYQSFSEFSEKIEIHDEPYFDNRFIDGNLSKMSSLLDSYIPENRTPKCTQIIPILNKLQASINNRIKP